MAEKRLKLPKNCTEHDLTMAIDFLKDYAMKNYGLSPRAAKDMAFTLLAQMGYAV